jgi:hypothetical protein
MARSATFPGFLRHSFDVFATKMNDHDNFVGSLVLTLRAAVSEDTRPVVADVTEECIST